MTRYKININRTPPTPEEIAKLRNFNQVLESVNGSMKPFYQKIWFISSAAAILIVGLVSTVFYFSKSTPLSAQADESFIKTIPVSLHYDSYTVNCDENAKITTASGTNIIIPKGSLVDEKGNPVTGEVQVKYREYKDAADFICSGIPMSYDSAGTSYYFESAGMFDISAFKDNKSLQVANEKCLNVEMATKYDPALYNQYYLDTIKKQWIYKGKDQGATADGRDHGKLNADSNYKDYLVGYGDDGVIEVVTANNKVEKYVKPVAPVKANPEKVHFNFNFDKKDFPELMAYKDILFDVGPENKNFKASYYDTTWENVKIEKGPKQGENFKMTLTKGSFVVELIVYPVFDSKNFASAQKQYAALLSEYNVQLNAKKEREAKERKEAEMAANTQYANAVKAYQVNESINGKFWHVVSVTQMGVWNNDCPKTIKNKETIYTTCADQESKSFSPLGDVYLIDKERNACIGYHPEVLTSGEFAYHIDYNRESENILVTFVDGKLAIIKPEAFKNLQPSRKQQTLKYEIIGKMESVEDVRSVLQL